MKRVAILQTGVNNPQLSASYPDYPGMFRILVGQQQTTPNIELISFPVLEGAFLPDIEKFDGFIITGSASGVYEDTEWMRGLFAFIRDAEKAKKKIAGFCFGHQAIAKALGGEVVKSEKGWGVGIKKHPLFSKKYWMVPAVEHLHLIYTHQDQVIKLPEGAEVFSGDSFCPYSAFSIGNHVLAMQGHPEFSAEFVRDLITLRKETIGLEKADLALDSLSTPHDGPLIGQWLVNFFCDT